ncbi:DUF4838 domain-containing protein [Verrucomicrobiota bacterium]
MNACVNSIIIEAHRGDSSKAPENTMAAFQRALELNVPSIELDVHPAVDGTLMVIHDATVDRTTNGTGAVYDKSMEELLKLDAGIKFSPEFTGEKIPVLVDVLKLLAQSNIQLNIEIKTSPPGVNVPLTLGMTGFAQKNGMKVKQHYNEWTYYQKVVGKDLIIVGNDKKDPFKTIRRMTNSPAALLGTVKGACDFMREHVGVRFLFVNMDQSHYATRGDGLNKFNEDGSLQIDTRSIAFLPVQKVAVPDNLDLKKTPMMRASYDSGYETFYYIAMNYFPLLTFTLGSNVSWTKAVPPAEYAKSHPEYFALTPDGKRACDLKLSYEHYTQYCVVNKGVQDLMFKEAERLIANGEKTIYIGTMDGYRLCRCNCEECNKFFGMKAENREQRHARGKTGKLWQAYFMITERIRKKYPDVKVVLLNYQDTPVNAQVISEFPENVILKFHFASQFDFDKLEGVKIPGGICGFESTFSGFGQAGPYMPERTPEHMSEVVQTLARNNVKWSKRDGSIGYVRGMQAPAYYVYGRMMDDPNADWKDIYKEFCEAAFKEVASRMMQFFDRLHMQLAVYSDYFGVMMPGWNRKYSRSLYHDSKWHVMSIFTPEYLADAESILAGAEKYAKDPDVKARLHLIRIEFDYIKKMSRIFYLQNAWTMEPSKIYLDPLVDAIDDWHAYLKQLAKSGRRPIFKPLSDWPEMRPFNGHYYGNAALQNDRYQQQWLKTCLNWDTKAIRAGILTNKHELKVSAAGEAPGLESKAWEDAPESIFKKRGGMPYANVKTSMKILRDKANLYVRVESLYPRKHPEDLFKKEPDENIFNQEYVELGIMPPDSGGKVYRIAVNPIEGSRYDSVIPPGKKNRMIEDVKWNGKWDYAFKTNIEKSRWNQAGRIWTAWFKIPFSDFGAKAPAAGEVWGFNAARKRVGYMLWSDAPCVTDTNALGRLTF